MNAARRLVRELRQLSGILDTTDMARYLANIALAAPSILASHSLVSADRRMNGVIKVSFCDKSIIVPVDEITRLMGDLDLTPTFGAVREMYSGNVYLAPFGARPKGGNCGRSWFEPRAIQCAGCGGTRGSYGCWHRAVGILRASFGGALARQPPRAALHPSNQRFCCVISGSRAHNARGGYGALQHGPHRLPEVRHRRRGVRRARQQQPLPGSGRPHSHRITPGAWRGGRADLGIGEPRIGPQAHGPAFAASRNRGRALSLRLAHLAGNIAGRWSGIVRSLRFSDDSSLPGQDPCLARSFNLLPWMRPSVITTILSIATPLSLAGARIDLLMLNVESLIYGYPLNVF